MVVNDLLAENSGISNYDTPRATETRRAFVRHINDFLKPYDCEDGKFHIGLPKSVINPEIDALINEISIKEGKPVDVLQLMRRTIWRIVWQFLFGKKSQLTDEQVDNILEDIASNNLENQLFQTRQLLPWFFVEIFRRIPFARHLFKVEHILKRHKAVRREIDSNTGELSNTNSLFGLLTNDAKLNLTKSEISRLSYELMAAGTDTTSLTLTWACDYLSRAPPQDPFNLSPDVIDMVHRWASVVPLALPHLVHESFEINGYCIPKSSILIYNLYAVHNTQLRRLTNKETKPKDTKQSDTPIPFSLGARACPGFRLANTLIEKVLTAINQEFIIQHFVQPPIETTNPKDQESLSPFGLTRVPYKSLYLFFTRTNGPRRTSN
ncbi:unnamed protein product [Heterobilharzia americana]|nr:unnamed protein product [Heterobilharzia americana]